MILLVFIEMSVANFVLGVIVVCTVREKISVFRNHVIRNTGYIGRVEEFMIRKLILAYEKMSKFLSDSSIFMELRRKQDAFSIDVIIACHELHIIESMLSEFFYFTHHESVRDRIPIEAQRVIHEWTDAFGYIYHHHSDNLRALFNCPYRETFCNFSLVEILHSMGFDLVNRARIFAITGNTNTSNFEKFVASYAALNITEPSS
jgi:hypothetical protein